MALARIFLLAGSAPAFLCAQMTPRLSYPPAPATGQIDDYHGTKIADPYRTLENAADPSTVKWIGQENELTFSWLAKSPGREKIRTQLTGLWNYEKFTGLYRAGDHYFYSYNSGLQNQSVLYVMDSLDGPPRQTARPP
jgi:prolyl oligopeptidase